MYLGPGLESFLVRASDTGIYWFLSLARRTARVMRTTNPIACGLREVAIRLVPIKLFVKVYARLNRRAGTDVTHAA